MNHKLDGKVVDGIYFEGRLLDIVPVLSFYSVALTSISIFPKFSATETRIHKQDKSRINDEGKNTHTQNVHTPTYPLGLRIVSGYKKSLYYYLCVPLLLERERENIRSRQAVLAVDTLLLHKQQTATR